MFFFVFLHNKYISMSAPIITLTTDWGSQDFFAGMVKGWLYSNVPNLRIVDITHDIPPFDLLHTAFVVKQACTRFPKGTIHIIDVNSIAFDDHNFVVVVYRDQYYICTDNGLPSLVFGDKWTSATTLLMPPDVVTSTFVAYHLFCKVAALIATEAIPVSELGPARTALVPCNMVEPIESANNIVATIQYIDSYGNAYLNLSYKRFEELRRGRNFVIHIREFTITKITPTYGVYDSSSKQIPQSMQLSVSASGFMEICINHNNAKDLLGLKVMTNIRIEFTGD